MSVRIVVGDVRHRLSGLADRSIECCVTSPPYFGLRDYGVDGQIGLEDTPAAFVAELVGVFREVRRVLRDDGTLWLNLGDSYWTAKGASMGADPKQGARRGWSRPQDRPPPDGLKPKDLIGIPWRVAFALQEDGWYLRSDIIWHKPNPMPESVTDRPTSAHEHIFLLTKSPRYFYDADAIREPHETGERKGDRRSYSPGSSSSHRLDGGHEAQTGSFAGLPLNEAGRNARNVWTIATRPYSEAHFATFPPDLAERCIKAGCPVGGTVLDPFGGAGTTGLVADRLQRNAVLIELNPAYAEMARARIASESGMFSSVEVAA